MRLKSIELQGFKSFVDRTRLDFDHGITAILGPNGCGKSNVVDAVRWVLGEQSAKQLRGGKMDDIIFKGTTRRKPVGMAEVTLTFENEDRGLPIDFSEVAIRRRVTRDGGSDYFLNGSACRLKDLRDLFFDSGVNNTSYSIIEESMIKSILNENNDDLRRLLEEGSGITRYKARRKETQRKLDRTQSDLVRLYDIIEEIGKEVRSLQRQVGKARRHQRLYNEIRALDLMVAGKRHQELDARETEARDRLQEFRTLAEAGVGELAELQARIEAVRPTIDEREAERRQLQEALHAFEEELQETERQVLVLEHRIDEQRRRIGTAESGITEAEERQAELNGQVVRLDESLAQVRDELEGAARLLAEREEELQILEDRLARDRASLDDATTRNLEVIENDAQQRSRLRELQVKQENRRERAAILVQERQAVLEHGRGAESQLQEVGSRVDPARQRRQEVLAELAGFEREETDLEIAAGALQEEAAALAARREAARSTHGLLRRLHEDYEGYGKGPRELLRRHTGEARLLGGLADQLSAAPADLPALASLLGEVLDAVVVDGWETAADLVGELRRDELGQASLICRDGFGDEDATFGQTPAGGRPAREAITGPGASIPALRGLLARSFIFATDAEAAAAAAGWRGPVPVVCVSREGLLVTSDGRVRGGRGDGADTGLLGRREKLEEVGHEIEALEERTAIAQQRVAANRARREDVRVALIHGRGRLSAGDNELNVLQVQLAELTHRRDAAGARAQEMEDERLRLEGEIAELADAESRMTDLLDESGRLRLDSTTHREDLRLRVEDAQLQRDEARANLAELRMGQQRRESRQRETETALAHLRESIAELFARRERLAEEIESGRLLREALVEELAQRRETLSRAMDDRERRRLVVNAAADGIAALHEETAVWNRRVQEIERQRGGFREQAHGLETELATLDVRRNNLEERVEEQWKGSFRELVASVVTEHIPSELETDEGVFQISQAEELLEDRRRKLAELGPINHLALEEYDTKKERLDFLEKQRDDVEKARDDLTKAIAEINRTARKRFIHTFEEVRRNYIAVFETLFKGGRCDLKLQKTDDPLESDILITAQPTGKVIDTVSLLSGGERCLTALSLLFAVYLVKPSPFCMLDEADAPLDDANIGRFVNMLREFSRSTQFLVITHNKLTMETANHLYGVTMMEPGCSSIVSVSFHDVALTQSDQELGGAIARKRLEVDEKAQAERGQARRETIAAIEGVATGDLVAASRLDEAAEAAEAAAAAEAMTDADATASSMEAAGDEESRRMEASE
ncbi:MAG: chromosome segregation protein SMC [bacterium]|nr:chromosome segregation protein SMC [bacterium]